VADNKIKHVFPSVELVESLGELIVRITGRDGNSYARSFDEQERAVSFAMVQCMRLGLETYRRV